jgi:uncharacterized LabA/DUF88 family protein
MQKAAIFVDAGYYYAQGSYAAFGETVKRHDLECDEQSFLDTLSGIVTVMLPSDSEILRTYWYDGARNGAASPSQLAIGSLSRVKMRLGRINGAGQQKGVDTLIVRDLMVLSQERSITHAFVLSGDEDLREGVAYAQDRGVVVTVLGIRGQRGTSQSAELEREADHTSDDLTEAAKASLVRRVAEVVRGSEGLESAPSFDMAVASFVSSFTANVPLDDLDQLRLNRPIIPKPVDSQLLRHASREVASGRPLEEQEKRQVRRLFWSAIDSQLSVDDDGARAASPTSLSSGTL